MEKIKNISLNTKKRLPNVKEINWAIFLYCSGLSDSLSLIKFPLFGTTEIKISDFIFFLPVICIVRNWKFINRAIRSTRKKGGFLFYSFSAFYVSLAIGIVLGIVRGNPIGLVLGDARGVLFILIGFLSAFIIYYRIDIFATKKLIFFSLVVFIALPIQMFILRDNIVLFNFHQDAYTNFQEGYGRYILPVTGVVFISITTTLLFKILRSKRKRFFNITLIPFFLITIWGSQSKSLIIVLLILLLIVFIVWIYQKMKMVFYFVAVTAIVIMGIFFSLPYNNSNQDLVSVSGRELPGLDFFVDPESYQSSLPEAYDRYDQYVDACDYITQNSVSILGGGAGVIYRTPTWNYLESSVTKKDNYLTFSDSLTPYIIVKQGFLGLFTQLVYMAIIFACSIRLISRSFAKFNEHTLIIALLGVSWFFLISFVNPVYTNDMGYFLGLFPTLTILLGRKNPVQLNGQ